VDAIVFDFRGLGEVACAELPPRSLEGIVVGHLTVVLDMVVFFSKVVCG
jgi:hypothetical protein